MFRSVNFDGAQFVRPTEAEVSTFEIFNAFGALTTTVGATLYLWRECIRADDRFHLNNPELIEDFMRRTEHLVEYSLWIEVPSRSGETLAWAAVATAQPLERSPFDTCQMPLADSLDRTLVPGAARLFGQCPRRGTLLPSTQRQRMSAFHSTVVPNTATAAPRSARIAKPTVCHECRRCDARIAAMPD